MTRLLPRFRETIAARSERSDSGRAGAIASGRDALPSPWSPTRWSGNVVPFARPHDPGRLETIQVDRELRLSSPQQALRERYWLLCVLAASAAMHATAFFAFDRAPPPLASVGVEAMSVEIVLGSNTAAGLATKPTQSEASVDATAAIGKTAEVVKAETAREAAVVEYTSIPIESDPVGADAPTATAEAKPPPKAVVEASTVAAEIPPDTAAPVKVVMAPPKPKVGETKPQPKRRAETRRARSKQGEDARTRESRASVASVASSGIGRGRSDADSNYRGIVAAQLARHKSFPPDARRNGDHGNAVVSFGIDGGGRVTAVTLVRATGFASLDREAQAMVRRASPFPPPPSRHAMRFTVPVSFDIR